MEPANTLCDGTLGSPVIQRDEPNSDRTPVSPRDLR
jgi:hypothetical protein